MVAESALRSLFPRRSVERGDEYFLRGRVRTVGMHGDTMIKAVVQGTRAYTVTLEIEGDHLAGTCECPWFQSHDAPCKHVWAAVRAASARDLLPDRALFVDFYPDEDDHDTVVPFRRPESRDHRPHWERFLEALGPANRITQTPAPRDLPDEILYVLVPTRTHNHNLTFHILGRARKKNGEWGKWKPVSLRLDDVQSLDEFNRDTLALLHQRTYGDRVDAIITIAQTSAAWWIERLARAGRLALRDAAGEPIPLGWDDGPPWTFRAAITSEATQYRITATLERGDEKLPFDRVVATLPGILLADGRAARFDDAGRAAWLHAIRASGPISVPHADADRFREALLRAPIAGVSLPPELGWELATVKPRPVLSLMHDGWSTELHGDLLFDYDEWRVSVRSPEMQKTIGRKLLRRDRSREEGYRGRLGALRAIAVWDGFRIRLPQLEEIARTLIAEGWALEIDSAPLRVTDDVDVELSSGIDWFDLTAHATFGDTRIGLPELLAAAEAKRSLMRLSDGSYGIVPIAWAESLAPVIELGKKTGDGVRFRASQALLIDALLQSKTRNADATFTDLRERLAGAAPEPRQEPPTLNATLRPYQRAGLGWLHFLRTASLGGVLADDMGLGKTVQTLALLEGLRADGNTRPSLVVAPRSLLFNWAAEAKRFAPQLRVLEHHGSDRALNTFDDVDVVLTTYATMRLDIAQFAETEFEYVILDEAQAIKNASSQVAKASRLLRGRHRLALSGTPIENHLGELWSLFEFLNPGLLGSTRAFSRSFASKTAPPERREALARALRPLILRRTKEQVAPELPERTEQTLYCELEGKQKKQYDELRDHYRAALLSKVREGGMDRSRMQVLEALLRLRQAACHPALIDPRDTGPSAKLDLLLEEIRDVVESGHRALVFSQFTSFLGLVREQLQKDATPHLYLDGRTRDRQSLVETFQRPDGPPLFLISLKAGGLGLNLTNADYIFLLDPWWNPAVEAQAIDRAHRIGRTNPVVAYRLIARDTVEEKILELQARKRELAESIISEDNSMLRKLEVEDLEMLLS
jgi:superfamily II DNA or RNA helicase